VKQKRTTKDDINLLTMYWSLRAAGGDGVVKYSFWQATETQHTIRRLPT